MNAALHHNLFFIRNGQGTDKNSYEVYDAHNREMLMHSREQDTVQARNRFGRFKRGKKSQLVVSTASGDQVLSVKRGMSLIRPTLEVFDSTGKLVGKLKQRLLSLNGGYHILDDAGASICSLQGKLRKMNFSFMHDGSEIATVTREWKGAGKDMIQGEKDFIVKFSDSLSPHSPLRMMVLAALVCK